MAKNHFALERPRRINISIPGYDANASARDQQTRIARRRKATEQAAPKPEVAAPAATSKAAPRKARKPKSTAPAAQAPGQHPLTRVFLGEDDQDGAE